MNRLVEKGIVSEMACGSNFAYLLNDDSCFLPTEYKVLQSQSNGGFLKCMKMSFNGHIQMYYMTGLLKPFSSLLVSLDPTKFFAIVGNIIRAILEVKNNGFLSCVNIDASFDGIYVDPTTYEVCLVYLPLSEHLYSDDASFENELRANLVKLTTSVPALNDDQVFRLSLDLQNGAYSLEDVLLKLVGKTGFDRPNKRQVERPDDAPKAPAERKVKLVLINSVQSLELEVSKNEFVIGKKGTNVDGLISFNPMISRVHCKITKNQNDLYVTDMHSVNGTYVNNVRTRQDIPFPIRDGDVLRLANSEFRVVVK